MICPSKTVLQVGEVVRVTHIKAPRPNLQYNATVVLDDRDHVLLRATRTLPSVSIGPVKFEPGDLFEEHYWRSRWFGILQVSAPSGKLKGWYGNISCPAEVSEGSVVCRDLELDLWIPADGTALLRLDEEEFAASALLEANPQLATAARAALVELETIVVGGGLGALLARSPNHSIEATSSSKLRLLAAAPHVKR